MSQLEDIKDAICEALDRRPGLIGSGTSSLQVDVRFYDNGQVKNIAIRPTVEFLMRQRPSLDGFQFEQPCLVNGVKNNT